MPPRDDEEWLRKIEREYRDLPDVRIEADLEKWVPDSGPRKILLRILEERRSAAQQPENERFRQTYIQTERHHTRSHHQAVRTEIVAWVALAASIVAILLQQCSHAGPAP
jgi:hypothetical protein